MAQEIIDVGAVANDGTGDPLRTAFEKINNNFSEIFGTPVASGPNNSIQYNVITIATGASAEAIVIDGSVSNINVLSNGINYLNSDIPLVTITPAPGDITGFGAKAVATLDGTGGVANINVTDSGANYTLPPIVEIESITNNLLTGSGNLLFTNNSVTINGNILPKVGGNLNIGNSTNPVKSLYVGNSALQVGNIAVTENANTLSFNVAVFPSTKANFIINNLNANSVNYGNTITLKETSTFNTTNDSSNQVAISLPVTDFSTCTFEINTRDENANCQSATISSTLINDGSGVRFNAYGGIFVGDALVTYDMDVTGGLVRLLLTPLYNVNMSHNINYKLVN